MYVSTSRWSGTKRRWAARRRGQVPPERIAGKVEPNGVVRGRRRGKQGSLLENRRTPVGRSTRAADNLVAPVSKTEQRLNIHENARKTKQSFFTRGTEKSLLPRPNMATSRPFREASGAGAAV